jgi:protein tyrosine phosphatase
MEEHLNDKNKLSKEWDDLSNYEAEPNKREIASLPQNMTKNRYSNILPCTLDASFSLLLQSLKIN